MSEEKDERKELEVVSGDGSELDISPAYEHLNDSTVNKPGNEKPKNIVVPKEINDKKKDDEKEGNE